MIKKIGRIILVGSSHVAKDSIKEIESQIENIMPEVVCLELDHIRFKSLMSKDDEISQNNKKSIKALMQSIKDLGAFGFLFANIAGYVQKKIGKKLGVKPGIDMKSSYLKARELKIPVALIDQNIKITMKKLSKLSFFKKISLFSGILFKSMKKENRELLEFDLNKVPDEEIISKMVEVLKKESPLLYKILIEDRNKYMVKKIIKLQEMHQGNILAVVGAGHVNGMIELLEKEIVTMDNNSINFSFSLDVEDESF